MSRQNYPRKCFWTKEKETWIKISPRVSVPGLRTTGPWARFSKVPITFLARKVVLCFSCLHPRSKLRQFWTWYNKTLILGYPFIYPPPIAKGAARERASERRILWSASRGSTFHHFPKLGESPGAGVLSYNCLMGTCGQPGYVFRDFCLKQGRKISDICLKQGQGMGAAPHLPTQGYIEYPPGGRACSQAAMCTLPR